jgi:hypothetical protein
MGRNQMVHGRWLSSGARVRWIMSYPPQGEGAEGSASCRKWQVEKWLATECFFVFPVVEEI